ncbi:MAG: esterase-like activity of phytase family protein [Pseudomonadota bacterium]
MFGCIGLALALSVNAALAETRLILLDALPLPNVDHTFAGISGVEMSPRGKTGTFVTDRGFMYNATFLRNGDRLQKMHIKRVEWPIPGGDIEGIATLNDGKVYLSGEGPALVVRIAQHRPNCLAPHPDFIEFEANKSLEALAIADDGRLLTLPERPLSGRDLPIYQLHDETWSILRRIPFDPSFLPVGADVGPDGNFYLLERSFSLLGFRSRIRRFNLANPESEIQHLLTTHVGQHDNLEGLSVWRDQEDRLRITMVSDDNFNPFQRSEIVEYMFAQDLAQGQRQD